MKKLKQRLRLVAYIILILLAAFGLSVAPAPPVMTRKKGTRQKDKSTVEVEDARETDDEVFILEEQRG